MKIFNKISLFSQITKPALVAVSITALTACASLDTLFKQSDSPLPIEVRHSGNGRIMSFRAFETPDRLYVSGSANKNHLSSIGHIDVQLIGANEQVISEKRDKIEAIRPRPGGGKLSTDSYVASFPLSEARQAVKIRVIYHSGSHS